MVSSSISPLSYNFTKTFSELISRVCTRLFSLDLSRSWVFVFGFRVRSFLSSDCIGSISAFLTVSVFGLTTTVFLFVLVEELFLFGLVGGGFVVVFVVELLVAGFVFTSGGLLFTGVFFFLKKGST